MTGRRKFGANDGYVIEEMNKKPPCRTGQCKAHRRTSMKEFDARRMY